MSIDRYLGRQYRPGVYNCLHFATDVWRDLTGQDVREKLESLLSGGLDARELRREHVRSFRALNAKPADDEPCLVLFQKARSTPHFGVWIRGRVLHIKSQGGVQFVPLYAASVGFDKVRFILPC